jgi:hypothetical protein
MTICLLCYIRAASARVGAIRSEDRFWWGSPTLQKCGLIAPGQNAKRPMFRPFSIVGVLYVVLDVSDLCSFFIRAEGPVLAVPETQHWWLTVGF